MYPRVYPARRSQIVYRNGQFLLRNLH